MKIKCRYIMPGLMGLALMVVMTTGAYAQDNTNAPSIYAAVKDYYQKGKIFKADVRCELYLYESVTNYVTGQLAIEFPTKWSMRLESPASGTNKANLVMFDLSDGVNRWTYYPATRSILKQEVLKDKTVHPKSFFPSFELYDAGSVSLEKRVGDNVFLKLKSVEGLKQFASVILEVNSRSLVIEKMEFVNWKGKTSMIIEFTNVDMVKPLDKGIFSSVNLPAGLPVTTVLAEQKEGK